LYYFFDYIERNFDLPLGAGLFQYISFRAGAAALLSLIITITFGKSLINYLRKKQVGEDIRDLGLEGQIQKKGTPTMGGLIIIAAILIPTLLMAKLDNVYVILLIATTLWLGFIGFVDDYIKVFKKNKEGLAGRFKIVGQVTIGLVVGLNSLF
jgi:phospho-N-acetylmuramoyl-pentapeptide-transferase